MTGSVTLHGFTHTLIGAVVIGTLAGAIGKPISERVLNRMDIPCHGLRGQFHLYLPTLALSRMYYLMP